MGKRSWTEQLHAAGFAEAAAEAKAAMFSRCAGELSALMEKGGGPRTAVFVPGRIEVLGKHTDYCGGRSMVCASEPGFCAVAAAREDDTVRMTDVARGERIEFQILPDLRPEVGHWGNYPMTVARRIARNFPGALRGADVVFASDLPSAAGMSSSSAMIVMTWMLLDRINGLSQREEYRSNIDSVEALGGYLGTVENGQSFGALAGDKGVGTFGGSEDHTAILCCQRGQISQYSYAPVRFERRIAVPPGYAFAVAVSGIVAEKTGEALEKYNRVSRLAAAVLRLWNSRMGRGDATIAAAMASMQGAANQMRRILRGGNGEFGPDELMVRFEQFIEESERIIPAAGDALAGGDFAKFGELVDRSQELAEKGLGNQTPETIALAASARRHGAAAASAFGAGFGGSAWALVKREGAGEFIREWRAQYTSQFPDLGEQCVFLITEAGASACELEPPS